MFRKAFLVRKMSDADSKDRKYDLLRPRFGVKFQGVALLLLLVSACYAVIMARTATVTTTATATADATGVCLAVRAGGGKEAKSSVKEAEAAIQHFLRNKKTAKFYVHGWRWHTLALKRDAIRLEQLALRKSPELLEEAASFVVDFNMMALLRIEDDLFFPWLRDKLCSPTSPVSGNKRAFRILLDDFDLQRTKTAQLGSDLKEQARIASMSSVTIAQRSKAATNVARLSSSLASHLHSLLNRQDLLLVPAVAILVPKWEQQSFNSKVIRNLGILDSRIHLVGMHDAVWEENDLRQRDLFEEAIPSIPRMMIPRWKKYLYQPMAGVLDKP